MYTSSVEVFTLLCTYTMMLMIYLPSTTSRMAHLLHYNYYYLLIYNVRTIM